MQDETYARNMESTFVFFLFVCLFFYDNNKALVSLQTFGCSVNTVLFAVLQFAEVLQVAVLRIRKARR